MKTNKLPVLFLAHGSPMNAVEDNPFTQSLQRLGQELTKPKAILCVSAHWYGAGSFVSSAEKPETIHDFGGFPRELYRIQYPALGHPALAEKTATLLGDFSLENRGLDHGTWSVMRHLYPNADVPIFQVSLNSTLPAQSHFDLGSRLSALRNDGILLVGSGNVAHNLGDITWDEKAEPFPWAVAFDKALRNILVEGKIKKLIDYPALPNGDHAVPTPDHYLPFLWMLGASEGSKLSFPYEGFQNGSLSMRCIRWD